MIEIQHLNLTFGEGEKRNQVLDDVNISVRDGEIYGLVGESGSGKTTVLKCLAGLFTHWEGELAINGKRLEKRISQERCRRVQMVFQDPYGSLHPRHTIGDILEEPLHIHRIKNRERRVHALLDKVGLSRAFRDRYPHQLSGGSASAWRWHAVWCASSRCCCSTNPFRRSTRPCVRRCSRWLRRFASASN